MQKVVEEPRSLVYMMGKALKNQDEMAPTIKTELHLDYDEDQKSHCGGVLTIIAKFVLLWVIYTNGSKMVMKKNPYL